MLIYRLPFSGFLSVLLITVAAASDQTVVTRRIKQVIEQDQRADLKNTEHLQKSGAASPDKTDSWFFCFWKPLDVNIHMALSTTFLSQTAWCRNLDYCTAPNLHYK